MTCDRLEEVHKHVLCNVLTQHKSLHLNRAPLSPLRLNPDLPPPQVEIITQWPDHAAEEEFATPRP